MLGKHCYWIHWQCRHLRGSGGTHGSSLWLSATSISISSAISNEHINIINPISYQIHNSPTFEIADHPAPSSQRRPRRKRRCEVLDIPHNLFSLNLKPLRSTHIKNSGHIRRTRLFQWHPQRPSTHSNDDMNTDGYPEHRWISCT